MISTHAAQGGWGVAGETRPPHPRCVTPIDNTLVVRKGKEAIGYDWPLYMPGLGFVCGRLFFVWCPVGCGHSCASDKTGQNDHGGNVGGHGKEF